MLNFAYGDCVVATRVDDNNSLVRFDDDRVRFSVIGLLALRDIHRVRLLQDMSTLLFMQVDVMVPVDENYDVFACVHLPREP
jgi:hypothetical protein